MAKRERQFYTRQVPYEIGTIKTMLRARIPKAPLILEGLSMEDVMHAAPGTSIGCVISNMCNRSVKLPFKLVAMPRITSRTAIFPTKLGRDGMPTEGFKYEHSYRRITDANDRGDLKKLATQTGLLGQPLCFYPAPVRDSRKSRGTGKPRPGTSRRGVVAVRQPILGSGLRALKAGLITKPVLDDMKKRHPNLV